MILQVVINGKLKGQHYRLFTLKDARYVPQLMPPLASKSPGGGLKSNRIFKGPGGRFP